MTDLGNSLLVMALFFVIVGAAAVIRGGLERIAEEIRELRLMTSRAALTLDVLAEEAARAAGKPYVPQPTPLRRDRR